MPDLTPFLAPLLGGVAIGAAASVLWVCCGRIAGITGVVADAIRPAAADATWKRSFLAGLLGASALLALLRPDLLASTAVAAPAWVAVAGLLVGFGTRLANGCTSGHGVCGLARGSSRSLVATVVFIGAGILTVAALRVLGAA